MRILGLDSSSMPRALSIAIALLLMLAGTLAAQPSALKDQAKKDVAAGLAAQNAGRYDDAIALYKKAYDAVPHPEILFNLAQAYRLKGDADTAFGMYQRYLAVEPRGRVAADARRWSAELEKLAAKQRADKEAAAKDAAAKDAAAKDATAKDAAAREAAAQQAREAAAKQAATPPPPVRTLPPAERRDGGGSSRRTYAVIVGAAGAASLIGGGVFGVLAKSKRDAARDLCGSDGVCDSEADTKRANADLKTSRLRGTFSTVLFGVGGAGIAIGAVLWFTAKPRSSASALAPVVTPSSVGVAWGGSF